MDFTFLFIIIIMLLAVKNDLNMVAVGLFALLLFTSNNKFLLAASFVGFGLLVAVGWMNLGNYFSWVVLGSLFIVMLLLAVKDSGKPAYGGGGFA
jgi:hypothetical protein